ncbi:MAG: DNA primase [Chitinophagales bacterium]|nr:DNA primase [Chitinophagales bacterium]MBP9549173.1 DNA primase [Chitinophagales bacterium]
MIPKETIDKIMDAARVEEVIADFVTLKKRGSNYIGLCPFHNEKTPSFSVSPVKGIYKCFGCGKSGNAVGFVMEHEHFTYREALKFVAAKYQIEVQEKVQTEEDLTAENLREGLYIINSFAQNYFHNYLLTEEEGKNIGLSYFKERGLITETIEAFKLGYCPSEGDTFSKAAIQAGYNKELLQKLGLTNASGNDQYRGRIIFPIHSITSKVLGFGARTLSADKKIPKYINSPENEIYVKSKIVYGIAQARKSIADNNECFLVEGYMDVVSMYQSGIINTVASSGTSLTQDQVRLIKRYTSNLTIIYDGDAAGIKAALRGLDIALEEGLNVKVVLLPDGDDPDTFVQKKGLDASIQFFEKEKKDLIHLHTSLFLEEAGGDPVKVAGVIKDIVQTISLIPDPITRSLYIKQTSKLLEVTESVLVNETNKILRKRIVKRLPANDQSALDADIISYKPKQEEPKFQFHLDDTQERDIVRLLLENSNSEVEGENGILRILRNMEDVEIENQLYNKVLKEYIQYYTQQDYISQAHFINHPETEVRELTIDILQTPYELSDNWAKMHDVHITNKVLLTQQDILKTISFLKLKKVVKMKLEIEQQIKELQDIKTEEADNEINLYLKEVTELQQLIKRLSIDTGTVVLPYIK